jgi:hypothetical protein
VRPYRALKKIPAPVWHGIRDSIVAMDQGGSNIVSGGPAKPQTAADEHQQSETHVRTSMVFMPKDHINFRLCGKRAMDWTDEKAASAVFTKKNLCQRW